MMMFSSGGVVLDGGIMLNQHSVLSSVMVDMDGKQRLTCEEQRIMMKENLTNEYKIIDDFFGDEHYIAALSVVGDLFQLWKNFDVLKSQRHAAKKSKCSHCKIRREELLDIVHFINKLQKCKEVCENLIKKIDEEVESGSEQLTVDEIKWLHSVPPYCHDEDDVVNKNFYHYMKFDESLELDGFLRKIREYWEMRTMFEHECTPQKSCCCFSCMVLKDYISSALKIFGRWENATEYLNLNYKFYLQFEDENRNE